MSGVRAPCGCWVRTVLDGRAAEAGLQHGGDAGLSWLPTGEERSAGSGMGGGHERKGGLKEEWG